MKHIPGGYILKARSIQQSEISKCSPCVREVWDWLLMNAAHKQKQYNGFIIERGQLFCSYSDIRNGLAWYIGWRKMTYSERSTKDAMKRLRKRTMIRTTKRPRGMLVTICKYSTFQASENYEAYHEAYHERYQEGSKRDLSINKNDLKNKEVKEKIYKKEKKGYTDGFKKFWFYYPRDKGTDNKSSAFRQWTARLKEKDTTEEQMIEGTIRYHTYCDSNNMLGTNFIKMAATFLGRDKYYLQSWEVK